MTEFVKSKRPSRGGAWILQTADGLDYAVGVHDPVAGIVVYRVNSTSEEYAAVGAWYKATVAPFAETFLEDWVQAPSGWSRGAADYVTAFATESAYAVAVPSFTVDAVSGSQEWCMDEDNPVVFSGMAPNAAAAKAKVDMIFRSLGFLVNFKCYVYAVRLRRVGLPELDWCCGKLTRQMIGAWKEKTPVTEIVKKLC